MSTLEMAAGGRATGVPIPVRALQALLLGPLGALVVFGSIYFGVLAPPNDRTVLDWLIGVWALGIGVGSLVIGVRLASGGLSLRRAALVLVTSHVVFGIVKVVGYGESEAAGFIAFDVIALALLYTPAVRTWSAGSTRSGRRGR